MTPQALKALKESIEVWEQKLREEDPNKISIGVTSCPLCYLYHVSGKGYIGDGKYNEYPDCRECPIYEKDRSHCGCRDTPYGCVGTHLDKWINAKYDKNEYPEWNIWEERIEWEAHCKKLFRLSVQAELDFLISHLPEEKQNESEIKSNKVY